MPTMLRRRPDIASRISHVQLRSASTRLSPLQVKAMSDPGFIRVYSGAGGRQQSIPTSMVGSFTRWIKSGDTLVPIFNSDSKGEEPGWVDPVSFSELWLPEDLPLPLMRPALICLSKDGVIRHLMPGMDISVQVIACIHEIRCKREKSPSRKIDVNIFL
jgi:hypothetical protein